MVIYSRTKKKICRPLSYQEYSGTKRKKRNSGINYVVNVSSSGTNLNKKIQDEMTKLENVEKRIRTHKTKVKEICSSRVSSEKSTNDHKLKHLFEEMMISVRKVPKKRSQKLKEVEIDIKPKKREKSKKCVQSDIKMVSLTDLKDKLLTKNDRDTIKIISPMKKSSLKKPKSAPNNKRYDSLAKDLKFAESLNFRKDIELHLSISDMKQIVNSKTRKIVADTFKSVDSTPSNNDSLKLEEENNESFHEGNIQQNTKVYKPERKRFYSSLRRGNYTISQHTDGKMIHKEVSMKDPPNQESEVAATINVEQSTASNVSVDKEESIRDNTPEVISLFPTNFIKRSILAVENVLRTINSITKDISSKNVQDKISDNLEKRPKINQSALHLGSQNQSKEIVVLKTPVQSLFTSEDKMEYPNRSFHKCVQHFVEKADFQCNCNKIFEPKNKAFSSSRKSSIRREGIIYFASEQSIEKTCSFSSSYDDLNISQRLLRKPDIFFDDYSPKKSYLEGFTNNLLYSSDEWVDEDHKKTENNFHFREIISNRSQKSDIFPEYNFERCLSLLRKKFRDFERMRQENLVKKNTLEIMTQPHNYMNQDSCTIDPISKYGLKQCNISNVDESYQVCFKNENFKNQSETSLDSWNKSHVKKCNSKLLGPLEEHKAKSTPEINCSTIV